MESRYKIVVSNRNKNIFKEIELPTEAARLTLGTGISCDVRLHKSLFFEPVELYFVRDGGQWLVSCSDNLYLSVGDVKKLISQPLEHGDTVTVKYQDSDAEVFTVDFLIDFSGGNIKYEREISLAGANVFTIGSAVNSNIAIGSPYVEGDIIRVARQGSSLHLEVVRSRYGVLLNGSRIGRSADIENGDFFSVSDFFFYLKDGSVLTQIRDDLHVNGMPYTDRPIPDTYPKFNRSTRLKHTISREPIQVLDPPAKPQEPRNNLLLQLLPSLGMIMASGIMAFFGRSMIVFSIISSTIGILTSFLTIRDGKKQYKISLEEREQKYKAYIERKREEIESERAGEKVVMEELYISQAEEKKRFETFSPDLFERSPEDEDFLCVRLGSGDVEARRRIDHKKKEQLEVEDELQMMPEELSAEYRVIHDAPVVCDLKTVNAVGVTGSEAFRVGILKNMVIDLVARQYYSNVQMVFAAEEENADKIKWLRMLPHVCDKTTGMRMLVTDNESKNVVFEYLYKELSGREQNEAYGRNIVVFFYDECGFKTHPISRFVDNAQKLGVTFVFFGQSPVDIPMGCGYLISQAEDGCGCLIRTDDKDNAVAFAYPQISDGDAEKIMEIVAPVYSEAISLEGSLTKNISLFELLNILAVDDIDLRERWNMSQVYSTMAAPIGVTTKGTVFLDLHDKAHGPHGLVAGTTGSGKSELLQTYILSMSTLFHPYEVGFVIIDFKGGGLVNQFKELPHLLGAITNIDGKEIERSLKSIRAELQKRQRLFAQADVNHIDRYIKKYRAGEAATPLPHLILIVDEFAELKAQQPEFMKELISTARIGRSLGVHLILATQKPSGQVNEQIWSNSRFKLCLKVQDAQDSNEVLKSPLAAEIKEPGRAYLQVGNNEIFELFQSAYSGAPAVTSDTGAQKEFDIFAVSVSGKRKPVFSRRKGDDAQLDSRNQLEAIVEYVQKYCEKNGIAHLPSICLPPLQEIISFQKQKEKDPVQTTVSIGVYDDPERQYQGWAELNLTAGNSIFIGSSQMGKTNLLQTIVKAVAENYSPEEVTMYIIDFNSMILKNFENLAHVGGVVTISEDEALKNLFKLLYAEITKRKEKLLQTGVSSFTSYREAGKRDLPQILLMVDNLTALKEMYLQDEDVLLGLCRDGPAVGISVLVANSQTSGIGYRYLSSFSNRLVFFCNDSGEYSTIFEHSRLSVANIPGRCLVELNKSLYDCQTFLAFEGDKEFERVNAMRAFVQQVNERYSGQSAAAVIPVIPKVLTEEMLADQFAQPMKPYHVIVGLDYASVKPVVLDMTRQGLLAISGKQKMGRSNFIRHLLYSLEQKREQEPVSVCIIDDMQQKLSDLRKLHIVSEYSLSAEKAMETIGNWDLELKSRYDSLMAGEVGAIEKAPLLLMIIQNNDIAVEIGNNRECLAKYMNFFARYKAMKVAVIYSNMENANIPYGAPETIKPLRETHHFLFFDDLSRLKLFDAPMSAVRQYKKAIEAGDCYLTTADGITKMRTVYCDKV